jgi:hypothetical protein
MLARRICQDNFHPCNLSPAFPFSLWQRKTFLQLVTGWANSNMSVLVFSPGDLLGDFLSALPRVGGWQFGGRLWHCLLSALCRSCWCHSESTMPIYLPTASWERCCHLIVILSNISALSKTQMHKIFKRKLDSALLLTSAFCESSQRCSMCKQVHV